MNKQLLNKVPEVTIFFWVIKIMATTVGETAADYLNDTLGFGLTLTSIVMSVLLIAALVLQFRRDRYVPSIYWLAVVFISVVGTLITDNLTDGFGVPLLLSTIVFSVLMIATFAAWYVSEHTLSIHTIFTRRREAFYWGAILFTFALGTAAGDYIAETLNIGYWKSALMFGGMIAIVTAGHYLSKALLAAEHRRQTSNAVLAFWLAYILTRPLGASIGDYLSQPRADGGLGLGTTVTSAVFLATIIGLVSYLTITKRDVTDPELIETQQGALPGLPGDAAGALATESAGA
ncbi:MAG: COG4705 family protein [Solirubrobacterales bacterium]